MRPADSSPAAQPQLLLLQFADPSLGGEAGLPFGVAFRFSSGAGLPLLNTCFALSLSGDPLVLEGCYGLSRTRVNPYQFSLLSANVEIQHGAVSLQCPVPDFFAPPAAAQVKRPGTALLHGRDYMPMGVWLLVSWGTTRGVTVSIS